MTFQDPPVPVSAPVLSRSLDAIKRWDWPTIGVFCGCGALWVLALAMPSGWLAVQVMLLILALSLHSSLTHEILHGHPFHSDRAGTMLGLFQPGLCVPYLRFKALHLAHHRDANLTDPYDDPETNYLDPAIWNTLRPWQQRVLTFNNTLFGRMLVGPAIGTGIFVAQDVQRIREGDAKVAWHWLAHIPSVVVTLWLVSMTQLPIWAYLLACYGALSVLRIRTFLEHQAHERASGRSVIIEDRGLLAFLFLNNNYHVVHHMHPQVAWYKLPALYRARKDRFLRINQGYVYRSYGQIFRQFFLRCKDPVAHPLWQPKDD